MSSLCVLVAGGTGGHVFPALSLAQKLIETGHTVEFYTDPRGALYIKNIKENPQQNLSFKILPLSNPRSPFKFYISLILSFLKILIKSIQYRPKMVIGFGGYPALAWGLVAGICHIPLIIHEQNAILGRTNKLLSLWAQGVASTFLLPNKFKGSTKVLGIPIRDNFSIKPYPDIKPGENLTILILGGSQGAKIFSEIVPKAIQLLPKILQKKLKIIQQCRPEDIKMTEDLYLQTHALVKISSFFNNVADLLEESHLVIARAGASTLAEIVTINRPAILVPYPSAQNNHQTANARLISQNRSSWLIEQSQFSSQRLKNFLEKILQTPHLLILSAKQIKQKNSEGKDLIFHHHNQSSEELVKFVLELTKK